jgi:tetratricopeptide (TPR) repeat protein
VTAPPLPPSRGARARRRRFYLLAGAAALAAIATAAVVLRPRPAPYVPGAEAAGSDEITRRLSRALPPGAPSVRFTDAAREAGISFRHFHGKRSTQLPEDMGSGAAWGDYDGDGDPDLFLVNEDGPLAASAADAARSPARSALYRSDGRGLFTEVTDAAGVGARGCGMGAAWGDYDGDGRLDLAVTRLGTNLLYRNNGDGTFSDVSAEAGVGKEEGFWTGASWADYDRDGDLDLYVTGYVRYRFDEAAARKTSLQYRALVPYTLNPSAYSPERNLLFRNDGRGRFREVAREAGVDNPAGRSLSAAWGDFDSDGWPDLYVANDISDNAMFRNLGNGRFQDVSYSAWVADYRGAMGLGVGDWDGDRDLDIFITHWIAQENALYDNQREATGAPDGPLRFLDVADQVGLGQIALDFIGWGTDFFDYDNDGRLDLFVANGSTFQREADPSLLVPMKNLLFWNAGREKGFFEAGEAAGEAFAVENVGRGAAFADYDGDGDLDVLVVVNGGDARLLRNDGGNARGWLRVVLRGPADRRHGPAGGRRPATTTFATGARVEITVDRLVQIREIGSGPSYLSQSPPGEAHFGIGSARAIERLEVAWPDGSRQTFTGIPANSTVTIAEGGRPIVKPVAAREEPRDDSRRAAVLRFWQVFNEATALRTKRDFARAAGAYEEALSLDPRHEDSLYYLGQCRQELGLHREARVAFARLVDVNPASARGHNALGALLASPDASAPLDLDAAEDHFSRAHAINGEETGPMVRLGEIAIVRADDPEAQRWLQAALRTNAKSAEAAFLLGYLRWRAGDREGAGSYYRRAVGAAAAEAPIKGVLSEGDRKASPGAGADRIAAPPLLAPLGKTLFIAQTAHLRRPGPSSGPAPALPEIDRLYSSMDDFVRALVRRAAASDGS